MLKGIESTMFSVKVQEAVNQSSAVSEIKTTLKYLEEKIPYIHTTEKKRAGKAGITSLCRSWVSRGEAALSVKVDKPFGYLFFAD